MPQQAATITVSVTHRPDLVRSGRRVRRCLLENEETLQQLQVSAVAGPSTAEVDRRG